MNELVPGEIPEDEAALLGHVIGIVEEGLSVAAIQVNSTLTKTYWLVGHAVSVNTLRNGRAEYGRQILASVGQE